jgi:Mn2+/Fe2+ NRAMP family transporter
MNPVMPISAYQNQKNVLTRGTEERRKREELEEENIDTISLASVLSSPPFLRFSCSCFLLLLVLNSIHQLSDFFIL